MAENVKVRYSPPWTDTSIIAIAGSSGSGKTSLSMAIVKSLDLPWVMVLSMVINGRASSSLLRIDPETHTKQDT